MAWRRMRWDGGDVDVADPFLCRQRLAVFSVRDSGFFSCMSKQLAIHVWSITLAASSRSLLVTWPSGLPQDTI